MRTLFSANPFEVGLGNMPKGAGLGQSQNSCVLIGTLSHKADSETLFDRTEKKYTDEGWRIVREKTGRVLYAGTKDEVEETNIWACPPEPANEQFLGQVPLVLGPSSWGTPMVSTAPGVCPPGSVDVNGVCVINPAIPGAPPPTAVIEPYLGDPSGRMIPYNGGPAYWNDGKGGYVYCDPAKEQNCPPQPAMSTFEMGQVGPHWARYGNERLRWPDCDPRYDANCPFPTTVITEQMDAMSIGQTGAVQGFGGPGGGGFGFGGGPGGLVGGPTGPVAGSPGPASGPITGPSIPCGPAGGPSCPPGPYGMTVMQNVYPIQGVLGRRALGRGGGGGGFRGMPGGFRGGLERDSSVTCGPGNWGPECSYPVTNLGKGPTPHGRAAEGHDRWYHPDAPCPPGHFRSSPGSPCVAPGDLEDYGEDYFGNPWV